MYRGRYREEAERRAGFLLVDDQSVDSGREELRELACWNRTSMTNRMMVAPPVESHRSTATARKRGGRRRSTRRRRSRGRERKGKGARAPAAHHERVQGVGEVRGGAERRQWSGGGSSVSGRETTILANTERPGPIPPARRRRGATRCSLSRRLARGGS
jgi:hypothetical protein